MNSEEIKVTMGLDVGPLALGLRKGEQLVHSFENSFAGKVFEHVFPLASIGGALLTLEKAINKASDLTRMSEESGISTGFLQDIINIGTLSGISETKIEKMLGAFTKALPVGSDVEEEFKRIADEIAGIEDPVTRAQLAIEYFGKSGYRMLPILEKGAAGIEELGKKFGKFSDSDIKSLDEADLALKQFSNGFEIWVGRILIGWRNLFEIGKHTPWWAKLIPGGAGFGLGVLPAANEDANRNLDKKEQEASQKEAQAIAKSMAAQAELRKAQDAFFKKQQELRFKAADPQEQVKMLQQEQAFLQHKYEVEKSEEKRLEISEKILEAEEKIREIQKKAAEETSKAIDKRFNDIDKASSSWLTSKAALERAQRPEFTLEELAKSGQGHWEKWAVNRPGRWVQSQSVQQAQEIERLREWAKQNAMSDDPALQKLAGEQWSKADKMFEALTRKLPFLKDPNAELKEHAKKSEKHLDDLLGLAKGDGINTNPAMGP